MKNISTFFTFRKTVLLCILVLACFLRLWQLDKVPPSISMDEASIGYNAYSVLYTGGDEYGQFPIISQRSYDDWRRSTYLFLTVPFIATLGLTPLAVRLPAALLSILSVWAIYYIVLLLFKKETPFAIGTALLGAFLLAITPWHIYISRMGHESNASLSFLVFGIVFFLQGLKKPWKLLLGFWLFILSMISYYVGQIFIPLFTVGLCVVYREELFYLSKVNKKLSLVFGISLLLVVPILWSLFSPTALVRFQGTSTFSPSAHEDFYNEEIAQHNKAETQHDIIGIVWHHRFLYPVKILASAYVIHFSPTWIFSNPSGKDSFKAPHVGLLYDWELLFAILGIGVVWFTKFLTWKSKAFILLYFLLAPLPAAIAVGVPHANRAYNAVVMWQVFSAFGIGYLLYRFLRMRVLMLILVGFLIIRGFGDFYSNYFYVFPKAQSASFYYAFSEMMPYVLAHENAYEHIVFANTDNMYQSYMGYLWYSKFDPKKYQKMGGTISGGYDQTHTIGKYEFRPIDWSKDEHREKTLLVGNLHDFPKGITGKIFYNLDTKSGIMLVER